MNAYFSLPQGYSCLQKNSSQVYAYDSTYRSRDTFELINFKWIKTATSSNNNGYTVSVCLPTDMTYLIPDSVTSGFLTVCAFGMAVLVAGLFKVFSR